jgi:hypothetical protein
MTAARRCALLFAALAPATALALILSIPAAHTARRR